MTTYSEDMPCIILLSEDNVEFIVPLKIAQVSQTLFNIISDLELDCSKNNSKNIIPLPNVTSKYMEPIIHFCEHHVDDDPLKIEEYQTPQSSISEWDMEFISQYKTSSNEKDELAGLVRASNYLDIQKLTDCGCKYFAEQLIKISSITNESLARKRLIEYLHIDDPYTDEEVDAIKLENPWCVIEPTV